MALKLPKKFHPDFSRPGVKPTGNVEIDWSNPLARHLVRAYAPAQGFFDFVAGVLTANSGVTQQRAVTEFAGTTGNKVSYNSSIDSHTELTVIAKVRRDRYTGIYNGGIYSEKNVGNWSGTQGISINFRQNTTSGLLFKVGSTGLLIDEDYAPVGEFNTLVFSWRASSYQRIYVNGSLRASAASPAASFTKSTVAGRMGVYYDESASRTLDGAIDYLYVLNKALSASEIASLSRDPYQILRPAQPMMLFLPAGGGGGTYTVTGSLSAVLQKQGIARQATLNAILQKQGLTLNSSVDALLQKSVNITGEIDAILQNLGITSVSSIDALLQKRGSVSSSLDAILTALTAGETTASIDAILKKLGITNTASLDSILQKQDVNVSASLSALLQKAVSLSSVMDAIFQKTVTTSASLDAILTAIGSGSLSANFDAILRKTLAVNLSIDALLQKKDLTVYASIDALLSKRQTTTATLDAILYGSASIAASLDALLKRTGVTITANLDAILTLSGSFITPKNLIYVMAEDRIVSVLAEDRIVKVI